jgi:hypothetical protein
MAYVTKQYRLSWITDTEIWVSALFVVGVFAAGFAAWTRRRRTLKRWEDEHMEASVGETSSPRYVVNYEIIRSRGESDEPDDPA